MSPIIEEISPILNGPNLTQIRQYLCTRLNSLNELDDHFDDPVGARHQMLAGYPLDATERYQTDIAREVRFLHLAILSLPPGGKSQDLPFFSGTARKIWKDYKMVINLDTDPNSQRGEKLWERRKVRRRFYNSLEVLETDKKEFGRVASCIQRSILIQMEHPFDGVFQVQLLPTRPTGLKQSPDRQKAPNGTDESVSSWGSSPSPPQSIQTREIVQIPKGTRGKRPFHSSVSDDRSGQSTKVIAASPKARTPGTTPRSAGRMSAPALEIRAQIVESTLVANVCPKLRVTKAGRQSRPTKFLELEREFESKSLQCQNKRKAAQVIVDRGLSDEYGRYTNNGFKTFLSRTKAVSQCRFIAEMPPCMCGSNGENCTHLSGCATFEAARECGANCTAQKCQNCKSTNNSFRSYGINMEQGRELGVQYRAAGSGDADTIPPGEILMYYGGEAVTQGIQFEDASTDKGRNPYGLLMRQAAGDETWVPMFIAGNTKTGIASRINHSCAPNTVIYPCWTAGGIQRVAIASKCHIKPNDYLSFDYNWTYTEGLTPTKCLCNADNCRGYIETGMPDVFSSEPVTDLGVAMPRTDATNF